MNTTDLQDLVDIANRERAIENIPALVLTAVVAIIGIVGNATVFLFYALRKMKTTSTYLMILLIGNDLLVSIIQLASIGFYLNELNSLCYCIFQLYFVTTFALNMGSLLLIIIIAIDTYRRELLKKHFSIKAFVIVVTGVYMYTFMTASRYFFLLGTIPVKITVNNVSFYVKESRTLNGEYPFWYWFTFFLDLLTYGMVFTVSAKIYRMFVMKQKVMYVRTIHFFPTGRIEVFHEKATSSELRIVKTIPKSDGKILELDTSTLDIYKQTTDELPSENSDNKMEYKTNKNTNRNIQLLITKMMCWKYVAAVVSYAPCLTLSLLIKLNVVQSNVLPHWQSVILRSYMVNTSINPYIIGHFNMDFRRFLKRKIFRCYPR